MTSRLVLEEVTVARGGAPIVRGVSLSAPAGEVTALLGPNGAGKTTLLESISGVIPVTSGTVSLNGTKLTGLDRVARARAGVAHVEQGRTVFPDLTVAENILVVRRGPGVIDQALELFPELHKRLDVAASLLSGGEQQMLVLARALAARPSALLIDEMSLGLAPVIVQRLLPVVRNLAESGVAVLLVEQFATLALKIADTAHVLASGSLTYSGPAAELRSTPGRLHAAYLGEAAPAAPAPGERTAE